MFYTAVLWFKVCIMFCSVSILWFYRRILCLSYNSVFKQWLLSGDCVSIRGLVSLSITEPERRSEPVPRGFLPWRWCSIPKWSSIPKSRWTCLTCFFSSHMIAYLAIEHDSVSGKWGKETAPTGWRWGTGGGRTKSQPSCSEDVEEKVLVKQAGGWSGHLWWNICPDQHKRLGFVLVWRRRYLSLEDSQWMSWCLRVPVENGTWRYGRKTAAEIKKRERASIEIITSHHHAGIISSSSTPKPCCNCHTDIKLCF